MKELYLYNLRLSVYENSLLDDSLIKKIVEDYSPEDAILAIFTKCGAMANRNFSYEERYSYFYSLAEQIKKVSGYNYTNDDMAIYALYALPFYPAPNKKTDVIKKFEEIFRLTPSGENEAYAKEGAEYKLLYLYSEQIDTKYEAMKKLLKSLEDHQSSYEEIKSSVLSKIG